MGGEILLQTREVVVNREPNNRYRPLNLKELCVHQGYQVKKRTHTTWKVNTAQWCSISYVRQPRFNQSSPK